MRYLIPVVLLLGGCATATEIKTGGTPAYMIGCHGMIQSLASCFEKANEVCPAGYTTIAINGEAIPIAVGQGTLQGAASQNFAALSGQQTFIGGSGIYRYLTVQCR